MSRVFAPFGHRALRLLTLAALLPWHGCGPSLRSLHEGARYFERCYAADLDPALTAEVKLACWERWLSHYAVDQPPERVTYARLRQVAITQGEVMASLPLHEPDAAPPHSSGAVPSPSPADITVTMDGPCAPSCRLALRRCARRCAPRDTSCLRTCRRHAHLCIGACP